jgi:glycerophosphoryl diester phosphodiesterase
VRRNADWKNVEWSFLADEKMEGWLLIEKSEKLGLKVLRVYKEHADAKLIHDAHAKGMSVFVFYADEESDMRHLSDAHVDGILTNRPDRLRGLIDA